MLYADLLGALLEHLLTHLGEPVQRRGTP
jgi:hypothetical protein